MTRKSRPEPQPEPQSKAERVYRYLRRRIRELELPPGARVEKNDIARECGVSRAPVSDAIARLANEGLVEVFPQSGSFVAPIRSEDIQESMIIRMGLEVEAVRRVTRTAGESLHDRLAVNLSEQAEAIRSNDMTRLDDLDEAFHGIIFGELKPVRAMRLLDAARAILDRPRFHALPQEGRPEATLVEHRRIADAIRTGEPEFAAAAMRIHLARVLRAIEDRANQINLDKKAAGAASAKPDLEQRPKVRRSRR